MVNDDHFRYWEQWYGGAERMWSGRPNPTLVRRVEELAPGDALDLGCGEGADAIWLAGRGWRVTAADVSRTALERAARHAAEAGVPDGRIDWQWHDLAESFPAGSYDLVSAQFLHAPLEFPRERVLRRAAEAVRPGGSLLVVGHADTPREDDGHREHHQASRQPHDEHEHGHGHERRHGHDEHRRNELRMSAAAEVMAGLELGEGEWETVLAEEVAYEGRGRDGEPATRVDSVVQVRRRTPS